jgi:hypothetical protein
MLEFMLRAQKLSVRDLPDIEQFIRAQMMGETDKDSQLGKAPAYIRDSLMFPYLAGTAFSQRLLRNGGSWEKFHEVFAKPPVSTHQILHPDLYLYGEVLPPMSIASAIKAVPSGWKKLDENTLGEFGLHSLLKQFLGEERAQRISPSWAGDTYVIFEQEKSKQPLLLFRVRLGADSDAARFFGAYSEALELKHDKHANLFRRPNFFSFDTPQGGVFLTCHAEECLAVEGSTRELFDRITRALGWPDAPRPAVTKPAEKIAIVPLPTHLVERASIAAP